MKFNIEIVDAKVKVTDAATGQALDWVDTVDFIVSPGATPILYLGTFDFSAQITAGPNPTPPVPVPVPPPAVKP